MNKKIEKLKNFFIFMLSYAIKEYREIKSRNM